MTRYSSSRRRQRRSPISFLLVVLAGLILIPLVLWLALTLTEKEPEAAATPAPTPALTPAPTPTPSPTPAPVEVGWELTLVNTWNRLEEGWEPELKWLPNGLMAVDARCYEPLQELLKALRAEGFTPIVSSAHRPWEEQQRLFDAETDKWLEQGLTQAEAEVQAGKLVAPPGTSEHQLGLAVDLCDISNQWLDEEQEDAPIQRWLREHSWEYGFILRYPDGCSAHTGISFEPWHYRYVGKQTAGEIHSGGLCLEEYLKDLGAGYDFPGLETQKE